jgi:hypothetical protein
VRVVVESFDGPTNNRITRTVQMDFRIDKKVRFAILSKSRVMIGRNVLIDGQIGSRFEETWLDNGHPVQMVSDFRGLHADLDNLLDALVGSLDASDLDGDNRLHISNPAEVADITDPDSWDTNDDGYIDDYDMFLSVMDSNKDGNVTTTELESVSSDPVAATQLLKLIDTFGDPSRAGYNDGIINNDDEYAKIHGQIMITASLADWESGAAGGTYQDHFQGTIVPDHGDAPLKFQADDANVHEFGPMDFDTAALKADATGDFAAQAAAEAAKHDPDDPDSPQPLGDSVREEVPFGSAHPYDYYDRPVYKNMTFTDVKIPKGTNALFVNCKFIGVTFIETESNNTDPNFNYAGMTEADGTAKFPKLSVDVAGAEVTDTKTVSNNVRFDDCTFEGCIVTDPSPNYTHVRNKIAFTGTTEFDIEGSSNLSETEKRLYTRSTILAPHYSLEMGTFVSPHDAKETVNLTGTIVAGVLDMRGQVNVRGSIITTFAPQSPKYPGDPDAGPVIGETAPNFNTTLGYFPSAQGDLEAELPGTGMGIIKVQYDPTIPLPNGILGPIEIEPMRSTYFEGRGN